MAAPAVPVVHSAALVAPAVPAVLPPQRTEPTAPVVRAEPVARASPVALEETAELQPRATWPEEGRAGRAVAVPPPAVPEVTVETRVAVPPTSAELEVPAALAQLRVRLASQELRDRWRELTPSTNAAFSQVFSRRLTYFGVTESSVSTAHGDFKSGFDSRQLHRYNSRPGPQALACCVYFQHSRQGPVSVAPMASAYRLIGLAPIPRCAVWAVHETHHF